VPESFIWLPPDSTGKKLRTYEKVIGGNTVHEQYVIQAGFPTFYFNSAPSAAAGPVNHWDVFNAAGSGVILKVRKLFLQQHYLAQTGVVATFDIHRTDSVGTGGTALTGRSADTADAALLPAQVTSRSLPTGGSNSVYSYMTLPLSGEETDVGARAAWGINVLAEGNETKDITLREGEGMRVTKTSGVVTTSGTWSVLAVVTVV
jgi:hypothetical protein